MRIAARVRNRRACERIEETAVDLIWAAERYDPAAGLLGQTDLAGGATPSR
jgi:hypothetical protein